MTPEELEEYLIFGRVDDETFQASCDFILEGLDDEKKKMGRQVLESLRESCQKTLRLRGDYEKDKVRWADLDAKLELMDSDQLKEETARIRLKREQITLEREKSRLNMEKIMRAYKRFKK